LTIETDQAHGFQVVPASTSAGGYRHEAFFYAGRDEFLAGTLAFIHRALAAGEPVLAVLHAQKITDLQTQLHGQASRVLFADMADVGLNPARIIPAWSEFVERHEGSGRRLWGIGEPIWAGRSSAELAECERHEALLNVAFADADFSLLCPYDTSALDGAVISEALRNHRFVHERGVSGPSPTFAGTESFKAPFCEPLPDPPPLAPMRSFDTPGALYGIRRFVIEHALDLGLSRARAEELVVAVSEAATNSLQHGGGRGTVQVWQDGRAVICEIRDNGTIDDPMAGRRKPDTLREGGRGLWLANQLCELVQIRSSRLGTVVRLHKRRTTERSWTIGRAESLPSF
jgi:anti-sigma regulatory factor (Ser/Thr protein kinase)